MKNKVIFKIIIILFLIIWTQGCSYRTAYDNMERKSTQIYEEHGYSEAIKYLNKNVWRIRQKDNPEYLYNHIFALDYDFLEVDYEKVDTKALGDFERYIEAIYEVDIDSIDGKYYLAENINIYNEMHEKLSEEELKRFIENQEFLARKIKFDYFFSGGSADWLYLCSAYKYDKEVYRKIHEILTEEEIDDFIAQFGDPYAESANICFYNDGSIDWSTTYDFYENDTSRLERWWKKSKCNN